MDQSLPFESGQMFMFIESAYARHWKIILALSLWTNDVFEDMSGPKCFQFELIGCTTLGKYKRKATFQEQYRWFHYENTPFQISPPKTEIFG